MTLRTSHADLRHKGTRRRRAVVLALLLTATVLAGCGPSTQPTLTAKAYGPEQPDNLATLFPTPTDVLPTAEPTPTVLAPTLVPTENAAEPAAAAQPVAIERQPVKVTILHTNDVMGEVEPCG